MSGPTNPPPDDEWGGSGGDEWRQPQQPQQPPQQPPPAQSGYQNAPPPPPQYGGQQGQGGPPPQNIPNYLVHSILATLLCCLPTGIVGIVFASQVNSKLAMGDVAGAQQASDKAKMWSLISVGAGVVVVILYFLLIAVAGQSTM